MIFHPKDAIFRIIIFEVDFHEMSKTTETILMKFELYALEINALVEWNFDFLYFFRAEKRIFVYFYCFYPPAYYLLDVIRNTMQFVFFFLFQTLTDSWDTMETAWLPSYEAFCLSGVISYKIIKNKNLYLIVKSRFIIPNKIYFKMLNNLL